MRADAQAPTQQSVVANCNVLSDGSSGDVEKVFEIEILGHASLSRARTLASSAITRSSASATFTLCARRVMYSSFFFFF